MSADTLIRTVAAEPPNLETSVVSEAVDDLYGLRGDFTVLVSERDQNFRLRATTGECYVVKIVSLAEDPRVTDFQIAALVHLERLGLPFVPSIVRTKSGEDRGAIRCADGTAAVLRIATWLGGGLLDDIEVTPAIAWRFGLRLAELDSAFRDFSHDGDEQLLLWDIQRAADLRDLLVHVQDRNVRDLLASVLNDFQARAKPAIDKMPRQVIHNDANTENVLVDDDGEICGIIDFGDMLRAPRVIEISNAAAYLRAREGDALRHIVPLVAGYHSLSPLQAPELDVLFDLIRARLAMTLIILFWRLVARDRDDPYRKKSLAEGDDALDFLRKLNDLGQAAFTARLGDKNHLKTAG